MKQLKQILWDKILYIRWLAKQVRLICQGRQKYNLVLKSKVLICQPPLPEVTLLYHKELLTFQQEKQFICCFIFGLLLFFLCNHFQQIIRKKCLFQSSSCLLCFSNALQLGQYDSRITLNGFMDHFGLYILSLKYFNQKV